MLKKFSNSEVPKNEKPKEEEKRNNIINERLKLFSNNTLKEQQKQQNMVNKSEQLKNQNNFNNMTNEKVEVLKKPKLINIMSEKINELRCEEKSKKEKNEKIIPKEEPKKDNVNIKDKINAFNNNNNLNNKNKPNNIEIKQKPKEEIKKPIIKEKINTKLPENEKGMQKKEETKKINNININNKPTNLNYNNKPDEKSKQIEAKKSNVVSERLKMTTAGNNAPKKQDKVQFKLNNEQNIIKQDNSNINKNNNKAQNHIKDIPKEENKRINPILEKNKQKKEEMVKPKENSNGGVGLGFAEKMKKMNELFKNQGNQSRRGKSVMVKGTKFGFGKESSGWNNNGSNNLGIISEEPDKMKPGYDPASNLQQTLDGVVINKRKRKMTRAVFKG